MARSTASSIDAYWQRTSSAHAVPTQASVSATSSPAAANTGLASAARASSAPLASSPDAGSSPAVSAVIRAFISSARSSADLVAGLARALCRVRGGLRRSYRVTGEEQHLREVEPGRHGRIRLGPKRQRALEQVARGADVEPRERSATGRLEQVGRASRDGLSTRHARRQLLPVAIRLLEVVAEHLVAVEQVGGAGLEPACEPLVQVRAGRLRQHVVRGVANQDVPESVGLVTLELCEIGTEQVLTHERGEHRPEVSFCGRECPQRAEVEDAALDGAALEHGAVRAVGAGRAATRAARGSSPGPRPAPSSASRAIAIISSTKSGLPSAPSRIRARSRSSS